MSELASEPSTQRELRPAPYVDGDNEFFWDGARQGRLLLQQCSSCRSLRHPPGPLCRNCRSADWTTVEAGGQGTIYSFVVPRHPAFPPFGSGYVIALIELEEGVRFLSNVTGCPPEDVHIGMPVELYFSDDGNGFSLPLFRPMASQEVPA